MAQDCRWGENLLNVWGKPALRIRRPKELERLLLSRHASRANQLIFVGWSFNSMLTLPTSGAHTGRLSRLSMRAYPEDVGDVRIDKACMRDSVRRQAGIELTQILNQDSYYD